MKRTIPSVIAFFVVSAIAMVLALTTCSKSTSYKAGTYEETVEGRNGPVTVKVVLSDTKIKSVEVTKHSETEGFGDRAIAEVVPAILKAQSTNVDATSAATITSEAIKTAVAQALKKAGGKDSGAASEPHKNVPVTYKAGTYSGTAAGMNGPVTLDVTFSDNAITKIKVVSSKETPRVGTPAFDIMFKDAIEANGSGVDIVSGATFTALAVKNALNDAAKKAGASDLSGFKKNKVVHKAQAPIEETYDVVVIGGGGAGIAAAAQAAQNGDTVLVIEKNAEIGGNTVVSGGQFQSAMPYLCWEADKPDATTGVYPFDGKTYNKVKMANGNIKVLKTILNWDEKPFEPGNPKDWFEAGDIERLSTHGVHQEYLPVLKELKSEIKAYLDWAEPKLASGLNEGALTLFSTVNLHIFQTYYGGLRPSADFSSWIYGDKDLVCQFIRDGQDLKPWLEAQGAMFRPDTQPTIVGALWNRENDFIGANFDDDGDGKNEVAQWGCYFAPPKRTLLENSPTAASNKIMLRTTAESLILEKGRVTGVKGTMYDGTKVTAHAKKGVVLATGGFAANIKLVQDTNKYWKAGAITNKTQTTNRSSLMGDGITMGEKVGADVTGMAYTQLMPISWIDNGQLAFGGGNYAVYIDPTSGKRFVNETSERDVLSLKELEYGIEVNGTQGVFMDIANTNQVIQGPYPYGRPGSPDWEKDVEMRQYTRTVDQLDALFKELGFKASGETVRKEIEAYDMALMTGKEGDLPINKTGWSALIGEAKKDANGSYDPSTYKLDGVKLKIRIMAPSTHHTMGGVKVDIDRHVLDKNGKIIPGLYAAGEVTGGIHGGNRLGGNAIVEIFVSGRTAANAIKKDNK